MDADADADLIRLRSLLDGNRAAQRLVRRQLQLLDDRLRQVDRLRQARLVGGADRPMLANQAVFGRDPLQDDHGCVPPKSPQHQALELILSTIPLRHEPGVWSAEKRVGLRNGVIHQNRVLLTRAVLKEGAELPPGPERNALIKAKLEAIRNMSSEQLLLNTNNIDWHGIALTHVRGKSATDCQIQWMCGDDPRINRSDDWSAEEDQALLELHEQKYHGFEWVKTASELGTRRTAVQCFQRYKFLLARQQIDAWTDDQDRLLKQLVDRFGTSYWSQVALFFPNRTRGQCSARYANSVQDWIRGGKWSADESRRLKLAVDAYGPRWSRIALHVSGRTQTKCRERYVNEYESAIVAKRQRFSTEEDEALIKAVEEFGEGNWARIAAHLQGRSDSQYRRRYARILANRAKDVVVVAEPADQQTPPAQAEGGSRKKRARTRRPPPPA